MHKQIKSFYHRKTAQGGLLLLSEYNRLDGFPLNIMLPSQCDLECQVLAVVMAKMTQMTRTLGKTTMAHFVHSVCLSMKTRESLKNVLFGLYWFVS